VEGVRVYGMVYRIHSNQVKGVLEYLDGREQGGYSLHTITCTLIKVEGYDDTHFPILPSSSSLTALTYLATPLNRHFLGDAPLDSIAQTIAHSSGPSGHNAEYLTRLHQWLESIHVTDDHVTELVHRVRRIQQQRTGRGTGEASMT